jgi:RsmE family RNA methyltransferase
MGIDRSNYREQPAAVTPAAPAPAGPSIADLTAQAQQAYDDFIIIIDDYKTTASTKISEITTLVSDATAKLSDQVSSHNVEHLLIIIGPEGGLTDEEIAAFTDAGAKVALMGRPILRSAHAGIAAVSAVSALLKVW